MFVRRQQLKSINTHEYNVYKFTIKPGDPECPLSPLIPCNP